MHDKKSECFTLDDQVARANAAGLRIDEGFYYTEDELDSNDSEVCLCKDSTVESEEWL